VQNLKNDIAEDEAYRHLYAHAILQVRKDFSNPPAKLTVSKERGVRDVIWWGKALGGFLEATRLEQAAKESASLIVPTLPQAVRLWSVDKMESWCTLSGKESESMQERFNSSLSARLDRLHSLGDPYLTAIGILANPDVLVDFAIHAGMATERAVDLRDVLIEEAEAVAEEGWNALSQPFPPLYYSIFRF